MITIIQEYIYVDNSSTTKIDPIVLSKMVPYLTNNYGNASSVYKLGRISQNAIMEARTNIANILNINSDEIYFTASGSESDNMAIKGIANNYSHKGKHIITSKIEHSAILNTCKALEEEGFDVTYLEVEKSGIINIEKLKEAIREDTILISIMNVNNEIGTIQPVEEVAKIAREKGIVFHTDAVQGIPHFKMDASKFDLLSLSAHKFNGPKGVGLLYVKKDIKMSPIIFGGQQESGMRAGTENVAGIVGMSEALKLTQNELEVNNKKEKYLRDYLLNKILTEIKGVTINGDMKNRIPGNINVSFEGVDTRELMVFLDMNNICVSTGSACHSSSKEISHVLKAIGSENTSLRITLSKDNTINEMDRISEVLNESIRKIRGEEVKTRTIFYN